MLKKNISWRYFIKFPGIFPGDRLLLITISVIVGICSGLAAFLLNSTLEMMLEFIHHYRHMWWAFLLPAVGAAFSSLFLEKIAKEGAGHGIPEIIYSVSKYGGLIRLRSIFSRLIASCLTIGSGGSAGPEAPVVMSGASIGSNIARFFKLNDRQRITCVGCGAAGAIASIFNAPLAGMIFSMEIILGQWSAVNIIPIAVASVAGAQVSHLLRGDQIAFSHRNFVIDTGDIIACIGLAVMTAVVSIIFTRMLRKAGRVSGKFKAPLWIRAAIGGCAVGGLGFFMPEVLGEGYDTIRSMIDGTFTQGITVVAIGIFAKMLATSLTLGSGGSGGIFAPCLVIGSFVGVTYHKCLVLLLPSVVWVDEGCFALLGMAGLISGILQAPLTGMFLILEITGSYEVMLPLIIISVFSTTITYYFEPASFYLKDLVDRGQLLRPGTDSRVLKDIRLAELLEKDCISIKQDMLLREFLNIVKITKRNYFPVEDSDGLFVGMLHFDDVRPFLMNSVMYDAVVIEQIMDSNVETVKFSDDLQEVLQIMDKKRLFSMPVIFNNRFIGMISKATLLDFYRNELMVQTSS